jgi:hypothetical protein
LLLLYGPLELEYFMGGKGGEDTPPLPGAIIGDNLGDEEIEEEEEAISERGTARLASTFSIFLIARKIN